MQKKYLQTSYSSTTAKLQKIDKDHDDINVEDHST